jgi:hypothetical protein
MSDPVPACLLYPGYGGHLGRRGVKLLMEAGDSNITAASRIQPQPAEIESLRREG